MSEACQIDVLKYDPFKKLPTKKLAANFLKNKSKSFQHSVLILNIKNISNGQLKRLPLYLATVKQRKCKNKSIRMNRNNKKSPKRGNPFQRHHLSEESRWLLRRLY